MDELSFKFTLTETTGIINTGWLWGMPFAWVTLSNSDGIRCFLLIWKNNALQFISMDALFDNPYDLLNTEYYDVYSAEFYAQAMYGWSNDTLTQKVMLTITDRCMNQTPTKHNGTERVAKTTYHEHQGRSCSFRRPCTVCIWTNTIDDIA
jgi:hypothetical protein